MKKNQFVLTAVLFLALCFSKLTAQTVYITDAGKKYHAKNCSLVKTGKKGIELSEAKKSGYEPCKICKAEDIRPEADKTKAEPKDKPKKTAK
ncbi:MAG: hypothetical protein JWO32_1753 [Bacteroidetes bacterium]|nr:hypothetical protein [Bacteroidota bacterium]